MGNGIRARHRNETTPVWAVYTLIKGVDESTGGTSGSFTISYSRYKYAASAYTVSSSGTISLTDAEQKTAANIAVGDYLVNVSTSNSTATTGSTLYKVTAVSGTSSIEISYIAYTVGDVRGEDTGERVKSDTMDYPINGIQGEYWYVLIRGYTTVYVWDIYNVKTTYGYKEVEASLLKQSIATNTAPYAGSSYTFNKNTGRFTITNATLVTSQSGLTGKWWIDWDFGDVDDPDTTKTVTHSRVRYGCSSWNWSGLGNSGTITATKGYSYEKDENYPIYSKSTATGKTAKSAADDFYPQDGVYGDYWLVYSHSYTGYIDMT